MKENSLKQLRRGGGRGKPTKEKAELRARIKEYSAQHFDKFEDALLKVFEKSPETACKIYLDLLRYSLPVLSSTNLEVEQKVSSSITDTLLALRDGVVSTRRKLVEDVEDEMAMIPIKVEDVEEEKIEELK